ncbi:hypothetical protein [Parasynechococcus sp.]|uniref:hypothetical protein n=1 Tax=Parasynechococcus sp. TaxID=3101203 RepID=UPI0037039322
MPLHRYFWAPAVLRSLLIVALIGWLARLLPQRLDQPPSSLLELFGTDSTVGSSVVLRVPPGVDHVPLEIRVGLVSQSRITAFQPGANVLYRTSTAP